MPSARWASRSPGAAVECLTTKPPLAPPGTITAFLTICALTRPSTSVRKSSGRSLQRSPPLAIREPRRWTPSTYGELTKTSNIGLGSGRNPMSCGRSLTEISARPENALVRTVASISVRNARQIRSSSSDGMASRCSCSDARTAATSVARASRSRSRRGSNRVSNRRASSRVSSPWRTIARSTYAALNVKPTWRRYRLYKRITAIWRRSSPARRMSRLRSSASISPNISPTNARWSSACCSSSIVASPRETPTS